MGDDERARIGQKSRQTASREAIPDPFDSEENSANYSGEALQQIRESRTLPDRVSKLEGKMDDVKGDVAEIKSDVKGVVVSNAAVTSRFDTYMSMQQQKETQEAQRAQMEALQQAARPHTDSIMRQVRETTTLTLADRVLDEQDKSRRFRRKFLLSGMKIVGLVAGGGGIGAVVHWLLEKL